MYKLVRNILFLFPAESVHHFSMESLRILCKIRFLKKIITARYTPDNSTFSKEIFGLRFRNMVGLGAGFDKNALYLHELDVLGFGFIEIGTVTPFAQPGNERPRLFRLRKDKALINRMGFNNHGVKIVAQRLREWRSLHRSVSHAQLVIGGNIGKNKTTSNEEAYKDYEICFRELYDCVDYFVVNVSSPNTPGLRELQEKVALRKILSRLQTINQERPHASPLLLKIAPDLSFEQIDDVIALAKETKLDGLVVSNTTISREHLLTDADRVNHIGSGGLSGAPLKERSTAILEYIHRQSGGSIPVIASGGVFNAGDACEKIQAGAALVQVWTGFIYEGPSIVKNILENFKGQDS
jgi:dihydroorotate dehydrogenase